MVVTPQFQLYSKLPHYYISTQYFIITPVLTVVLVDSTAEALIRSVA